MKTTPVGVVKERFQSKEKLVEAVQKLATSELWLDRVNSSKGLTRVSNTKLLRLHALLTDVQGRFGSRAKLIDSILELERRSKDAGYKTRLEGYALPKLMDLHGALSRRSARAQAKANPAPKKKAPVKAAAAPAATTKKRTSKAPPSGKAKKTGKKKSKKS